MTNELKENINLSLNFLDAAIKRNPELKDKIENGPSFIDNSLTAVKNFTVFAGSLLSSSTKSNNLYRKDMLKITDGLVAIALKHTSLEQLAKDVSEELSSDNNIRFLEQNGAKQIAKVAKYKAKNLRNSS